MFKLLEKKPFVRWKFVQRMVHKHRMNNRTGTNRYKTFSKVSTSNDREEFLDIHSSNESIPDVGQAISTAHKSPFHSKRRLEEANADIGLSSADSPKTNRHSGTSGLPEELNTTEITSEVASTDQPDDAVKPEDPEVVESLTSQLSDSKPQYNPLSFNRSSKLRNSFKEFKRRSTNQLGNARESVRRRTSARKYDNLDKASKTDDDDEEEIINYDRSPGSKRRAQVIEI